MANLPTDMELELAESHRNATRTPSPQITPCEQLKFNKAQLAKMETFRRCKQACVDALMMMPDHHPDEPFYVRALTELQDIEETMALADINLSQNKFELPQGTHFNNLENSGPVANENPNGSNNSASQNAQQNQLPPPIMLFVEKNYKAQMAAITKAFPKIRSRLTDNWKEAIIFPINKPGKDPHLASSYRPISLLSTIGKLTESIILHRLKNFINENNILNPNQYGFTNKLSTLHPLLRLTENISEGFRKRKAREQFFWISRKAFDRVWINGLTFKLITFKIPHPLIHLIHSYLTNRSFRIRINETLSNEHSVSAGCPQGSLLGPLLFNLYINDIPNYSLTKINLYADDTAIHATQAKNSKTFHPDEEPLATPPGLHRPTNRHHATQQNVKLHLCHAQHHRLSRYGVLRTVLQSRRPKINAYSTPIQRLANQNNLRFNRVGSQ
ncbi:probable RNA-directed DNA polymerase from transposon X-element [Trichonephila clavipes]|nr:probable RNA-directed DNA polymerase from transposon X-element [Trichonephila clavipes]